MRLAIMQPYLFPYLGYYQLINAVDVFIAYDDVHYIKGGWINRNYLLNRGKRQLVTLQVEGASSFKPINQVCVGTNRPKLLKTIEHCYKKAPFFHEWFGIIEDIVMFDDRNLATYVIHGLRSLAVSLGIRTRIVASSSLEQDRSLKGTDKVLGICRHMDATVYVNAVGGQALYSKDVFAKHSIALYFIRSRSISYQQFNHEFVPGLSMLDVIMFNPKETVSHLLNQYDLV